MQPVYNKHVHYVRHTARLNDVVRNACTSFEKHHPRAGDYAIDCIVGLRRWSGADLRGKGRKFSGSYFRIRCCAEEAVRNAGGTIIPGPDRRLETAVYLGADDYGNAIYAI